MLENLSKRSIRERDGRPAPTRTAARIWDMLCNHFFRLLWANLLCVLCCIPIVTIPASLSGLYPVVQQYYRKGYGDVIGTFFKEFKQNFLVRLLIVLALFLLPAAGMGIGSLVNEWAALVICAIFTVFSLLIAAWLFPQFALLSLKPMQALRNAALLVALETKRNFLLLIVEVLFGGAMILFRPISMLALLFLVPAAPVILLNAIAEPVLEDRIISKAEAEA